MSACIGQLPGAQQVAGRVQGGVPRNRAGIGLSLPDRFQHFFGQHQADLAFRLGIFRLPADRPGQIRNQNRHCGISYRQCAHQLRQSCVRSRHSRIQLLPEVILGAFTHFPPQKDLCLTQDALHLLRPVVDNRIVDNGGYDKQHQRKSDDKNQHDGGDILCENALDHLSVPLSSAAQTYTRHPKRS